MYIYLAKQINSKYERKVTYSKLNSSNPELENR